MAAEEITKVQELIYTTRVDAVMARDVIVTTPNATMAEVKDLLRQKRISGVPVVENGRMVGLVSMSDVMDAVAEGALDAQVHQRMTTDVKFIHQEASVLEAVNGLGRKGYNRLPVVDKDKKLVGIVTTGTIIRSLLEQMDTSFKKKEEEKLQSYRASHIFDDIVSDDTSLVLRYVVDDKDFDRAGYASSMIKKSLQRLRIQPSIVRRVAVAVYEAEMNLVIHTDVGGEITVQVYRDKVNITAVDHGPGIEDVEKVLQPGFSTAPEWIRDMGFGAGMGLANIRRCSDVMKLMSEAGGATRLDITFRIPRLTEVNKKPKEKGLDTETTSP
jgi:CBS domain-containing protein/anti-sigma regulatory factor (Ser/Thr protein kinase)